MYVPHPDSLRDYFLRVGADVEVTGGAVRVRHASNRAEERIATHLQHWLTENNVPVTVVFDGLPPISLAGAPAEQAAAEPKFFLERPRLGDLLQRRGLLTADQLEQALAEARETGDVLGRVLIRRRFIFGDELARTLADQLDLPYVNLPVVGFERAVALLVPSTVGVTLGVLPIGVVGGAVRVAFADPTDERAKHAVAAHVGSFEVVVGDLDDIESAWKTLDPTCTSQLR